MSLDIARARTALARELASLEEFLASDADWQALRAFEIQTGLRTSPQLECGAALALPEILREALSRNSIFQARARLYEALECLLAPELTASIEAKPPPPNDTPEPNETPANEASLDPPVDVGNSRKPPLDDLTLIGGITPAMAADLHGLGVTSYDDIACWSDEDVRLFASLLDLPDEILRQNWPRQAALLISQRCPQATGFAADNDRQPLAAAPTLDPAQRIDGALARLATRARCLPVARRGLPTAAELPEFAFAPTEPVTPRGVPPAPALVTSTLMAVVDEEGDDLRHIAFIDDQVAAQLNASGIIRFSDIAHFTVDQVAILSVRFGLGNRITCEQWIEQATVLAAGHSTAYASRIRSADKQAGQPRALEALLEEPLPAAIPLAGPLFPDQSSPTVDPDPGYGDFDFAVLDRSSVALPLMSLPEEPVLESPETEEPAAPLPPVPWMVAADQPIVPPPLPPSYADLTAMLAQEDPGVDVDTVDNADGVDDTPDVSDVWIVPRLSQPSQPQATPAEALFQTGRIDSERDFLRRRAHEDGPLLRNPRDWEPIEEAAVEIVPRSHPFPGVGPVSEAVTRLHAAVETPTPTISRILRAFQRR